MREEKKWSEEKHRGGASHQLRYRKIALQASRQERKGEPLTPRATNSESH